MTTDSFRAFFWQENTKISLAKVIIVKFYMNSIHCSFIRISGLKESWSLARSVICCSTVMLKKEESIEMRDIKILRAQLLPRLLLKEPKNKPGAKREDLERHGFGG